ncbi:MAG: type II secretion system F family protein, partial [Acidimicrobiia bacterium]
MTATLPPQTDLGQAPPEPAENKQPWYKREFYVGRAVKPVVVMNFARQASSFVRSGIPILEALAIVGEESSDKKMTEVLAEIRHDLVGGMSFSQAIAKHPKVFPGYFISMVHSSELTGQLDDVLDQLADYMDRDITAKRQVRSALTYPTFVLGLALVAVVVMSIWVLPKFKGLYSGLGAKLPLPTRMLLGITDFVSGYWFFILGGLAAMAGVGYLLLGGARGKDRRDRLALRLPVLGGLFKLIAVER